MDAVMDHQAARRLMAQAIEGRLSSDDERDLALHLVGCEDCKRVFDGMQHANPALGSIQIGEPATAAIDAAVHRATTVLRGEADPGPMGLTDDAPGLPEELDANTVRIDSGQREVPPVQPIMTTGPMQPPSGAMRETPQAHVRPIVEEPPIIVIPDVPEEPVDEEPAVQVPAFEEPAVFDEPELPELPPVIPPPAYQVPARVEQPPIEIPAAELPREAPPVFEAPVLEPEAPAFDLPAYEQATTNARNEIESLLDADRARFEPLPYPDEPAYRGGGDDDDDRIGPGPWLIAIAVTVVLMVLAGFLVARGGSLFGGGGSLPSADEVRSRVERAFTDMKSLKTSFDIQKLSLYRVGRDENSLKYSFSTGRWRGSINYDRSEGYKEDFTLTVAGNETSRAEIVQKADETRGLTGSGANQQFVVETRPPLGPPDGQLRTSLGLLEDSLGAAAALIAQADELEVVEQTERDGRQLYEIRLPVTPNELTRADTIEAALDANNFMPVIVRRTITRQNADVLGPSSALTSDNLDTAFGTNEKITTELIELSNVQYDEIVLPGDLALEAPEGTDEQTRDSKYERVTRAELGSKLDYEPLLPRTLPGDFEEQLFARYTGDKAKWGPGNALPGPDAIFHAQYFDGKTTIVISQRRMAEKFNLSTSPLQRAGLPMTTRSVGRDGKNYTYGVSPEVVPHVYGFIGDTFVIVSGYAPQNELVRIMTSLASTPVDMQAPLVSASPGASASPDASASPAAATASPAPSASATPIVTATP